MPIYLLLNARQWLPQGWAHDGELHAPSLLSRSLKSNQGMTDKSIHPQVEFIIHTTNDAKAQQVKFEERARKSLHGKGRICDFDERLAKV